MTLQDIIDYCRPLEDGGAPIKRSIPSRDELVEAIKALNLMLYLNFEASKTMMYKTKAPILIEYNRAFMNSMKDALESDPHAYYQATKEAIEEAGKKKVVEVIN